jgi:hypothetical protein
MALRIGWVVRTWKPSCSEFVTRSRNPIRQKPATSVSRQFCIHMLVDSLLHLPNGW